MDHQPTHNPYLPHRQYRLFSGIVRLLPYLVLVTSLALSVFFWFVYDTSLRKREALSYRTSTDSIQSRISKGLYDVEIILRGAAGLLNASDHVTRDEWRRYIAVLELGDRFPGILGVGFTEWIPAAEKQAHESRVRGEGFADYFIRPPGERDHYTAIIYLEPFDWRNQRAFGFDMFSEPVRRRAMENARDTGKATVAATVILMQETERDRQNGLLMYLPVYRRGSPIDTVEQRRAALVGFVYSPVRATDFVRSNLNGSVRDIGFELFSAGKGEAESQLFTSAVLEQGGPPAKPYGGLASESRFDLYGRSWRLKFAALPSFSREVQRSASWAVLAAGILISGLLSLISFLILAARNRALTIAEMHREREERYVRLSQMLEETQHIAHVGSWEIDLTAKSLHWSNETYLIHETTPAEYVPTLDSALAFFTERSRPLVVNAVRDAIEKGEDFQLELDLVTAKGRLVRVYSTSKVTRAGGVTTRIMGALQDITQRKEAEETLRESEEKYRRLVEGLGSRHCVFSHTPEGIFLYLSGGSESLFGIPAEELIGKDWRTIRMTVESLQAGEEADRRMIETQTPQVVQVTCIRPDGSQRIVEISYGPVIEDGRVVRMEGLCTDITEEVTLQSQLQLAQKMESVGRLAGGVAHDFNNLLTVILGHAEMGLLRLEEGHPVAMNLREIRNTAERSANLTRQLLAFASKQAVAPKVVDLNETVGAMLTMLKRLIGEDIHLVWEPGAQLWQVKIDTSQIDQILANLCINSRDAIVNTGTITLRTENFEADAQYCSQDPGAAPGEYVRLSVSDTGTGMDEETLSHIFEPFFTTKGLGHGTGLGLATVYGAVRQNSGFITVQSSPGAGSTFMIHLPRYRHEERREPAEQAAAPPGRGRETILLVEDEEAILGLTAAMLKDQGYTVLYSANPVEALQLARDFEGEIDLVITDVIMPQMNGKELVETLEKERPQIRSLYMSGYTADVIAHHGVLENGVHFIQKPFPMQEMAAKVREVLDKG